MAVLSEAAAADASSATARGRWTADRSRFFHHAASSPQRWSSRWCPRHSGTVNSSLTLRPSARLCAKRRWWASEGWRPQIRHGCWATNLTCSRSRIRRGSGNAQRAFVDRRAKSALRLLDFAAVSKPVRQMRIAADRDAARHRRWRTSPVSLGRPPRPAGRRLPSGCSLQPGPVRPDRSVVAGAKLVQFGDQVDRAMQPMPRSEDWLGWNASQIFPLRRRRPLGRICRGRRSAVHSCPATASQVLTSGRRRDEVRRIEIILAGNADQGE